MWIFFILSASSVIRANKIKHGWQAEDCYIFLPNGEKHDRFVFEKSTHNDLNITGNPG